MLAFARIQPQKQVSSSPARSSLAKTGPSHREHPFLHLQRTIGNQAVLRMLQHHAIQAKLAIDKPGDEQEQEADRISKQVMRMPEPQLQGACACGGTCPHCKTDQLGQGQERLQKKDAGSGDLGLIASPPIVDKVLGSPGQPLDAETRAFMEPRFGHDFTKVRIHSGPAAERSARDLNAAAYTVGPDIVFSEGRYAPHTSTGRHLLAHELTHVVQQSGSEGASPVTAGRSQLFRKPAVEAHYPTEEEQRKIEELLSRNYKTTRVVKSETGELVIEKGRTLTVPQITELAARLEGPFSDTLDSFDDGASGSGNALDATAALEVVKSAREAILDRFGKYTTRTATLTLDQKTTEEARKKAGQVLVILGDPDAARALARTIVETHCEKCASELKDLDEGSKRAVIGAVIAKAFQQHEEQLRRVAKRRVPGKHGEDAKITLRLTEGTMFYHTAVHELVHQFAHPAFHAAFLDERNIIEGFTDYFAHEIYGGSVDPGYSAMVNKIEGVREAMGGPFHFVGDKSAEESLRQAYFGGHLEYIGWVPSSPKEQKAVQEARGPAEEAREPAQWDAGIARAHAAAYRAQAQAQQGASRNVLQVGLFFARKSGDTIGVRYARVIARTQPYAKGQLFLEGQVLGSPSLNPSALGAALGIGAEYQEPYFYAGGGVRFVGTTLPGIGTNRLDVSPFVGIGIRPWQTIRVGVEGFAHVPLTGQDKELGAGITLGVEL
jgi:Domain of unknown function (DUF4157)